MKRYGGHFNVLVSRNGGRIHSVVSGLVSCISVGVWYFLVVRNPLSPLRSEVYGLRMPYEDLQQLVHEEDSDTDAPAASTGQTTSTQAPQPMPF